MTFDLFTGYEPVQLSMVSVNMLMSGLQGNIQLNSFLIRHKKYRISLDCFTKLTLITSEPQYQKMNLMTFALSEDSARCSNEYPQLNILGE